jgi:hypothetical protein
MIELNQQIKPGCPSAQKKGYGIIFDRAPVAQWTEHQPSKLLVVSSNLTRGAWDLLHRG